MDNTRSLAAAAQYAPASGRSPDNVRERLFALAEHASVALDRLNSLGDRIYGSSPSDTLTGNGARDETLIGNVAHLENLVERLGDAARRLENVA